MVRDAELRQPLDALDELHRARRRIEARQQRHDRQQAEDRAEQGDGARKRGRRAEGQHEDARADHCANAQRGQRLWAKRLLQTLAGCFRLGDQLVNGLAAEQLVVGSTNDLSGFRGWL